MPERTVKEDKAEAKTRGMDLDDLRGSKESSHPAKSLKKAGGALVL